MKISVYKLLGMVKDDNVDYEYVKYYNRINEKDDVMLACSENIIYKLDKGIIDLNDIVEILEESEEPEEPKGIPEKITTFFDDTLEEFTAETRINGDRIKEHFRDQFVIIMIIHKINEILDYIKSKGESND